MDVRFLIEQNIFLQAYYKINKYLYQLKNTENCTQKFILGNLMECQKKALKT